MEEMKKNNEKLVPNKKEKGATMLEYGVMVALILAVCIAVVKTIGTTLNTNFQSVSANLGN